MDDANPLLLNFNDACIYASDFHLLESSTAWLNDACIHFHLTRLQHKYKQKNRFLFIDPSVVSYMMHQCDDEDVNDLENVWRLELNFAKDEPKMIFLPINDAHAANGTEFRQPGGGNHWSMLVLIIHNSRSKFLHFDSCRHSNHHASQTVAAKVSIVMQLVEEEPIVECCETPQQTNGYDCGIFAISTAEALSEMPVKLALDPTIQEDTEQALKHFVQEKGGINEFAKRKRRDIAMDIRNLVSGS